MSFISHRCMYWLQENKSNSQARREIRDVLASKLRFSVRHWNDFALAVISLTTVCSSDL
jgi:hypothetical protein